MAPSDVKRTKPNPVAAAEAADDTRGSLMTVTAHRMVRRSSARYGDASSSARPMKAVSGKNMLCSP